LGNPGQVRSDARRLVKRVLFLADRIALVNQAAGAFKAHLPDAAPVNLVTERTSEGRIFISTYPTMMNLIDGKQEGRTKFGAGHFDLIVIDEAHRSVYQRYRAHGCALICLALDWTRSSSVSLAIARTSSSSEPIPN
jgi:type I site-specific restriction endonuclease